LGQSQIQHHGIIGFFATHILGVNAVVGQVDRETRLPQVFLQTLTEHGVIFNDQ